MSSIKNNYQQNSKPTQSTTSKTYIIFCVIAYIGIAIIICTYFSSRSSKVNYLAVVENSYRELENNINTINSALPIQIDELTLFNKMALDRKNATVVYVYSLEFKNAPISDKIAQNLKSNKLLVRDQVMKLACSNEEIRKMFQFMNIKQLTYKYYFKGNHFIEFSINRSDCMTN